MSSNEDLLQLILSIQEMQRRTALQLPLLVEGNIHYWLMRMFFSANGSAFDISRVLSQTPLYGMWHAYKHTLTVVFRVFFPVIFHLERGSADPP